MHGKLKCFLSCLPLGMIKMIEINFNFFISVKIKQLQSQLLLYLTHREWFWCNYLMPVFSLHVIVPCEKVTAFFKSDNGNLCF